MIIFKSRHVVQRVYLTQESVDVLLGKYFRNRRTHRKTLQEYLTGFVRVWTNTSLTEVRIDKKIRPHISADIEILFIELDKASEQISMACKGMEAFLQDDPSAKRRVDAYLKIQERRRLLQSSSK